MKNALLLLGIWLGAVIFAYGVVYWDGGGSLFSPPAAGETAIAVGDVVRVTIPYGWTASVESDRARLRSPDERATVWVAVFHAGEEIEAMERAWESQASDAFPGVGESGEETVAGLAAIRYELEGHGSVVVWTQDDQGVLMMTVGGSDALAEWEPEIDLLEASVRFGEDGTLQPVLMEL